MYGRGKYQYNYHDILTFNETVSLCIISALAIQGLVLGQAEFWV